MACIGSGVKKLSSKLKMLPKEWTTASELARASHDQLSPWLALGLPELWFDTQSCCLPSAATD